MSMRSHTLVALVAGVVGFSGAVATNVHAGRQSARAPDSVLHEIPARDARLFAAVFERIKRDYVDPESDDKLIRNAIKGMVSGLDPHSAYLDSQQFEDVRLSTMGSYPGVGIEVAADGDAVKILHCIVGSPAAQAGMKAGDLILRIDGVAVGSDAADAIERMRGKAGTLVHLTVRRPSTGTIKVYALQRAELTLHSVEQRMLAPGYGYVRISSFSDTTPRDLGTAIAKLEHSNHGRLEGLVLDLRDNPGGVLESGVAVADAFLNHGVIVTASGRTAEARFTMNATPGDLLDGAPIVVLVNGGTASAAEIVTGALRDHGRALIVGQRTYGKGTIQTVMPLSQGALKLTTSRYFTPSGVCIDGKGILPDVVVPHGTKPPADLQASSRPLLDRDVEVRMALNLLEKGAHVARTVATASTLVPTP